MSIKGKSINYWKLSSILDAQWRRPLRYQTTRLDWTKKYAKFKIKFIAENIDEAKINLPLKEKVTAVKNAEKQQEQQDNQIHFMTECPPSTPTVPSHPKKLVILWSMPRIWPSQGLTNRPLTTSQQPVINWTNSLPKITLKKGSRLLWKRLNRRSRSTINNSRDAE